MRLVSTQPEPITIKKYANRRLYNTGTSTYVTLEDLAVMVKAGEDFLVVDAKTGDDITHSVLTQIIFEQEGKGANLLPITFLRQLIRFYGDSMQSLVPSYLDMSIASLTREQGKLREHMGKAMGGGVFASMEEQVRGNMAMFEKAFRMFSPFPGTVTPTSTAPERTGSDIDDLKRQIAEMKDKIDKLAGEPK
jgi:polyhydroxyalkanoate synthesis repressor PhaR